jgi:glucose/mannose transport system permease protein
MKHRGKDSILRFVTLLPSVILVAIFVYGFIGQTAYVSLTDWGQEAALSISPEINFIGLDNYRQLFGNFVNTRFRQDIVNTLTYPVPSGAGFSLRRAALTSYLPGSGGSGESSAGSRAGYRYCSSTGRT